MTQNKQYDYVYNVEDYQAFDKLKELTNICRSELANIDWHKLIDDLQLVDKDIDVVGPSWQYATGNASILFESVDSISSTKVSHPSGDLGSWLFLILSPADNDYVGYKINTVIKETFPETVKAVQNLPGVFHAHLNRITPNFRVPSHIDDPDGKILSVVLTLQISKTSADQVTLTIEGTPHNFKDVEYFLFESQREHYADNLSDADWIIMSIQIDKSYFK